MTALIPDDPSNSDVQLAYDKTSEIIGAKLYKSIGNLAPGTQKVFNYGIYAGPKSLSELSKLGHHMDKVVDFGMFDVIAKPCLKMMNFIHDHIIRNYGVAIIILTLMIKLVLWPLGSKSYL
jgi:YidC/Oxa1 family membrane protein insertase